MRTRTYLAVLCGHGLLVCSNPTTIPPNTLGQPATYINGNWFAIQGGGTSVAEGQHTFLPTTSGSSPSSQATASNSCPILMQKSTDNGKAVWTDIDTQDSQAMCEVYCKPLEDPTKPISAFCYKFGGTYWDDDGHQQSDNMPDGTQVTGMGLCQCQNPLVEVIVDDLIKGLAAVGEISCKTWFTAIDVVVQVGLSAIPGLGAVESTLVNFAAQAAETIAYAIADQDKAKQRYQQWLQDPDNAGAAQAAGHGLMDTVCGDKYTPADVEKVFNAFQFAANFASAPKLFAKAASHWPPPFAKGKGTPQQIDDYLNSLNPGRGGKPKPPNEPKPTIEPEPTIKPKPTTKPKPMTESRSAAEPKPTSKPTASTEPKPSSKPTACATKGGNSGDGKVKGGKGSSNKDCDEPKDITLYSIKKLEPGRTTTPIITCSPGATQACAHYYSAIHKADRSERFTCSSSFGDRGPAAAVNHWKNDHKDTTWKSYTASAYSYPGKGDKLVPHCEVDEWPPNYFLEQGQMDLGTKDKGGQLVRWVPRSPNKDAGRQWKLFCADHDGDDGNGLRLPPPTEAEWEENDPLVIKTRTFNPDLVDLIGEPKKITSPAKRLKNGIQTTTLIWDSAKFTRAVFSFTWDFKEPPSEQNNWLLADNPCWPKDIAPDDMGYPLAIDDPWYDLNPEARDFKDKNSYRKPPSKAILDAAKKRRANTKQPGKRPYDEVGSSGPDSPHVEMPTRFSRL